MSVSVRESHARLLADSRASAHRRRLAQAVSRAEFLLGASRTVSAIQNPQRALEALVARLLDDLVDVAQVVVRTGQWELRAVGTQGSAPRSEVTRWMLGESPSAVDTVIRRGVAEEAVLPASAPEQERVVSTLVHDPAAASEIGALGVEHVAVLPLTARGRTFGALVLGPASGYGFSGAREFLDELAERVAVGLDATLVVAESRHVADVLRRSLAPADVPQVEGLDLATYYRVAHESQEAGGDLIDVHGSPDDVLVVCGDVAGKGVEAAVQARRIRDTVRTGSLVDRRPGWLLGLVNRVVVQEAEDCDETLATATCLRLRRVGDLVEADVANAGHPLVLLLRAHGGVEMIGAPDLAIGVLDDAAYAEATVRLAPGDTLLLHTDGVTEARGAQEMFGDERLHRALDGMAGLPARAIVDAVAIAVTDHLGDRPHDDIALVAVQNRPVAA